LLTLCWTDCLHCVELIAYTVLDWLLTLCWTDCLHCVVQCWCALWLNP